MLIERLVTGGRTVVWTFRRQGALIVLALFPIVFGFSVWGLQGGTAAPEDPATVAAKRGDIVVTVGGVGRIVQAKAPGSIARPSSGGTGSGSAGPGDAPADAVFPRASGQIARYLVRRGQHVVAGQALAVLDDGGVAAAATKQALNELSTARLELRQKRTSDPLKGIPPTAAEIAAGRYAITAADEKLNKLLAGAHRADVSAAWLEVRRAEAELETLKGGTPAARSDAIHVARRALEAAQDRLERALTPDPADVSAATADVRKAEAELAVLVRTPEGPLPEEIAAARQAVAVAEANLADTKAANPPNPAAVRAAQLELDRARADLALLLRTPRGPTAEEIASARQAVESARHKLARLLRPGSSPDVKAARLEVERARADLRRLDSGPSKAALASARQAVATAEARLDQVLGPPLRADVAMARLDIRRAQADLALLQTRGAPATGDDLGLAKLRVEAAQIRLETALQSSRTLKIRAPSSGTVTALLSVPGAPVDATTPIASVADLQRLAVTVNLSEFDVAKVRRGLKAIVSVDALGGEEFPGTVLFAAPTGTESNGLVSFPVQVALADPEGLRPGMNVSVRIMVAQKRDVLQVPLETVSQEGDEPTVTVVNGAGEASVRTVTIGLANNKSVEIVKGLREDERVELPPAPPAGEE